MKDKIADILSKSLADFNIKQEEIQQLFTKLQPEEAKKMQNWMHKMNENIANQDVNAQMDLLNEVKSMVK